MEGYLMAMSFLYALLGVHNPDDLAGPPPAMISPDQRRARRYYAFQLKPKREVREALYRAVYGILEYSDVNLQHSMAIGRALCNAISGNSLGDIQDDDNIEALSNALRRIVRNAIDEQP
jgi:hypothetical protein